MSQAAARDYATDIHSDHGRWWLHRYATALVGLTFLLILAGGNVTSKAAGLAVPDWPLSFQSVNPPGWVHMPLVRDEHGHRLIGAAAGLAVIGLVAWLRRAEPRPWVRQMGYAALAAVVAQGVMGGLRVLLAKEGIDTETSIAFAVVHGCFAQAFFCLTIAIALATSPRFSEGVPLAWADAARNRALRTWTAAGVAAVYGQLILGALLRHLGGLHATITHIAGALVVGACLGMAAQHVFSRPESKRALGPVIIALHTLYAFQLLLGGFTYLLVRPLETRNPVTALQMYVPTLHLAVGAIMLGLSFVLAFRAFVLTRANPRAASNAEVAA